LVTGRGECLTPKIVEFCTAKLNGKMLLFSNKRTATLWNVMALALLMRLLGKSYGK